MKKKKQGFQVSVVDMWSRLLAYQLFHSMGEENSWGTNINLSAFANNKTNKFYNHESPFPIIVGDQLYREKNFSEASAWDFSVYEVGSLNQNVSAYVKTESFGSKFYHNLASNDDKDTTQTCVKNFDSLHFLLGISSAAFASSDVKTDENVPGFLNWLAEHIPGIENELVKVCERM
eukprot:Pgem_evm1s752